MQEQYYIGTDLKFCITITGEGFSQDDDDWEAKIVCNNKAITYEKVGTDPDSWKGVITDGNGNYYIMVDTTQFQTGLVKMIVTAYVPDQDFDESSEGDCIRREVAVQDLCYIKKP
jgi:hypothetical protein